MSWLSPLGATLPVRSMLDWPPSSVFVNSAARKYASFSLSGATAKRV